MANQTYEQMLAANGYSTDGSQDVFTDYTREQKIAMTIAATGVDFQVGRNKRRKMRSPNSWLAVPSQTANAANLVSFPARLSDFVVVRSEPARWRGRPKRAHVRRQSVRSAASRNLAAVVSCAYCGHYGVHGVDPDGHTWHLDHVVPLAAGGTDEPGNLVKACRSCNLRKATRMWQPLPGTLAGDGKPYGLTGDGAWWKVGAEVCGG